MSEAINPRRTPLKGEPDFTAISDEKLKDYKDTIQDMIFAYSYYDKGVSEVLKRVFKQVSNNLTDRLAYDTMIALSTPPKEVNMDLKQMKKAFSKPKKIRVLKSI